jgi:multisubunit Na+/H+ antiporter MnhB subunit
VKTQDTGLRLLRAAIGAVVAFVVFAGGWLLWSAVSNPDVRLKRPKWVEAGFDHSYWIPVIVVTVGGAVLVGAVLWKAYRRLRAGEDLYEGRTGRGLRRRGERHIEE